jgi:hypothetical protein
MSGLGGTLPLDFGPVDGRLRRTAATRPQPEMVGYTQDLADKLARDCRRIMTSDWYQRAFSTRLSAQRQAVPEFETTQQGCRLATSVGGVLTGRGADIIVIDDPLTRAVRDQHMRFRANVVLIEDKASGTQLIQELVAERLYAVTRYQPQSDKVTRLHAQTAMIENGFVHLPEKAPWLAP